MNSLFDKDEPGDGDPPALSDAKSFLEWGLPVEALTSISQLDAAVAATAPICLLAVSVATAVGRYDVIALSAARMMLLAPGDSRWPKTWGKSVAIEGAVPCFVGALRLADKAPKPEAGLWFHCALLAAHLDLRQKAFCYLGRAAKLNPRALAAALHHPELAALLTEEGLGSEDDGE